MNRAPFRSLPVAALLASWLSAAAPEVAKIEPPNWWAGHSLNPVRLLIRGQNLAGAHVVAGGGGVRATAVKTNERGTYLFVDVRIDRRAAPGPRTLEITTPEGKATASFAISAPLQASGRFQGFSADDVIYLLMPDRFANGDPTNDDPAISHGLFDRAKPRYYHGGDFRGIRNKLGYLKDLGVTAIWLNPVYDNVNHLNQRETYDGQPITDYHGYGAVDFYAVDEHLGTMAEFRELVDTAHQAGLKVILDQVANHTGPYHPWVQDPPTPTWFNGTASRHIANTWQTWTIADPHAPDDLRRGTLDGWFIDILPDLNQNDRETAAYLIQNTLWWIGMSGIDGIRQDTLPYVPRTFWRDWMAAIRREYEHFRVIGEMFDGDPALVSFFQGGRPQFDGVDSGIDSLFDFPLYYPLRRAFAEARSIREVAQMLARDRLYPNPSLLVTFLGLHDVSRFMSEHGATTAGLKLAFTFLLTARGVPLIYYGDEIAMPGGTDPDNRRDFPGGWPGDAHDAFTDAGRTPVERDVFDHVRRVARLRAGMPALRRGRMVHLAAGDQIYAYARTLGSESVLVVINNGAEVATVEIPAVPAQLKPGVRLQDALGAGPAVLVEGEILRVRLPARSAAIYPGVN